MPRRTAQEAARTRAALIDAGVTYFSAHSYQDAALAELVGGMGITRGALYHHFGSKQGFFEAVLERVFQRLAEQIERASRDQGDGWAGLEAGCRAFMRAATDESFRRMWEFYLCYCEGGFAERQISVAHLVFSKPMDRSTL